MGVIQSVLQVLGVLAAVAFVFFLAWFLTRAVARNGGFNGRTGHFTVLEKYPLSKDSYLCLVRSSGRLLLVGVTPGGMTVLQDIGEEEADFSAEEGNAAPRSFAGILKATLNETFPEGGAVRGVYDRLAGKKKDGGGDA